jgi:hypothetical protein
MREAVRQRDEARVALKALQWEISERRSSQTHAEPGLALTPGNSERAAARDAALAELAARQQEAERAQQTAEQALRTERAEAAQRQQEAEQAQQELQRRLQEAKTRLRDPNAAAQVPTCCQHQ